jgi:hypothetical protein
MLCYNTCTWLLPPFHNTCRFDFFIYISFAMHLDRYMFMSTYIAKGIYLEKSKRKYYETEGARDKEKGQDKHNNISCSP